MLDCIPLKETDKELQTLIEIAEKFENTVRIKGRALTRTEKAELSGEETENVIRDHPLRRGFNLSKNRQFLVDDRVGSMEIDLMLPGSGVNPEVCSI